MERRYPIITKMAIAFALAFLATFSPWIPLRIIFAGAAGILFALCFKKFKVLMIVFLVLVLVAVGGAYTAINHIESLNIPWFIENFGMNFSTGMEGGQHALVNPNSYAETKKDVTLRGNGLKLVFKTNLSGIHYPSGVHVRYKNDEAQIVLDGSDFRMNRHPLIEMPSDFEYDRIVIYNDAATVHGDISTGEFEARVDALNVTGTLNAQRATVDTDALNWDADLDGGDFVFSSDAMNFNADIYALKYLEINSEILNGNVEFMDKWNGERVVELSSTFGNFNIRTPDDPDSTLNVNKKGDMFKLHVNKY